MAAPLSGIVGTQQQVPASQAVQPAAADPSRATRQTEQTPQENEIQPRDAATSQSQQSNPSDQQSFRETIAELNTNQDTVPPRGSVLDTTV